MKKAIKLILVILCMLKIFLFSNDTAEQSTEKSNSIIIVVAEKIIGRELTLAEKETYLNYYDFWIRKTAHLSIYLLLGLLYSSYLKECNIIDKRLIIYSIIFIFLYSISDELHQAFVPGRSCELRDIIIDTIGGTLGTYIYYFYYKVRSKAHG